MLECTLASVTCCILVMYAEMDVVPFENPTCTSMQAEVCSTHAFVQDEAGFNAIMMHQSSTNWGIKEVLIFISFSLKQHPLQPCSLPNSLCQHIEARHLDTNYTANTILV